MRRALVASALALGVLVYFESDSLACGGCFQPSENPTVVTDHRMLFSVSKDQTTLYDQIKYSGNPSSFGWVLPITGTVDIGLSADVVFAALDQTTQTRILPPPQNCPAPPADCAFKNGQAVPGTASDSAGSSSGGVTVLKNQVVGPYETVQLASTDPKALDTWLTSHSFVVPPDIEPVIAQYVSEKFNFLALKLVPGQTVQNMRPVRVTTQGASVALPLRMVAAGTGASVGISLWVISEGRYEPQNFPFFHIETDEIAWDWSQNKSNYTEVRAQKEQAGGGKIWEIESSIAVPSSTLHNQIYYGGGGAAADYDPVTNADGTIAKTADTVRDEDLATMFHGINNPRVTRMRGDIAHAALNADLTMIASADQAELSNTRQLTKELNEPNCPVYQGCDVIGQAPRSQAAGGSSSPSHATSSCDAAPSRRSLDLTIIGGGLAFAALAIVRARRKR
jgi:hypothetical protein